MSARARACQWPAQTVPCAAVASTGANLRKKSAGSAAPRRWLTVWRRAVWLCRRRLALAAIAVYANSFSDLVFDDLASIGLNPTIRHLWPIGPVLRTPANGLTVSGRPVLNLSFALNYAVGGTKVGGYHALNLLIHVLAGLTLFGIVRRTLSGRARCPQRAGPRTAPRRALGTTRAIPRFSPLSSPSSGRFIRCKRNR